MQTPLRMHTHILWWSGEGLQGLSCSFFYRVHYLNLRFMQAHYRKLLTACKTPCPSLSPKPQPTSQFITSLLQFITFLGLHLFLTRTFPSAVCVISRTMVKSWPSYQTLLVSLSYLINILLRKPFWEIQSRCV